jgi:hypothetical protein
MRSGRLLAQARGTAGGVLEHAPRHPFPGPTPRRCPLLGGVDTITYRARQFPGWAMALAGLLRHSPSGSVCEIERYGVIRGERQQ